MGDEIFVLLLFFVELFCKHKYEAIGRTVLWSEKYLNIENLKRALLGWGLHYSLTLPAQIITTKILTKEFHSEKEMVMRFLQND